MQKMTDTAVSAGVKPSHQSQAPQLLVQSDMTGSKLVTTARDVRLEYAWPETSPECVSWPLGWNVLEECGAKQPDSVTLAPDGNKLIRAQWCTTGFPNGKTSRSSPSKNSPGLCAKHCRI